MTKKDYVAIAQLIRDRKATQNQAYYGLTVCDDPTLAIIAQDFCSLLANDNPRFDRGRFLAACGVTI